MVSNGNCVVIVMLFKFTWLPPAVRKTFSLQQVSRVEFATGDHLVLELGAHLLMSGGEMNSSL